MSLTKVSYSMINGAPINILDFLPAGYVTDGSVDYSTYVQQAYLLAAKNGGGTVIWPIKAIKISSSIYFGSQTKTDLSGCTIYANNQNLFVTGYVSGGVLISNWGTAESVDGSACLNCGFQNGTIYNASRAFYLYKFLESCYVKDMVMIDCITSIEAKFCFYNIYENISNFIGSNFVPEFYTDQTQCATTTSGSNVIKVANGIQTNFHVGKRVVAAFVPLGTTVTTVGANDSGGSGFANVTLSNNATVTLTPGQTGSCFSAEALTSSPQFFFYDNVANIVVRRCGTGLKFIGMVFNGSQSVHIDTCSFESDVIGVQFQGITAGVEITSSYSEINYGWLFDFSLATEPGQGSNIVSFGNSNLNKTAGFVSFGTSGYAWVQDLTTLPTGTGFTPYNWNPVTAASAIDISSPNVVFGGNYGSVISYGSETILGQTSVPAGGTAGAGYMFSSTANLGIFFGSGVPTLSAAKGSLYLRTDGSSTSTRLYVNTNGSTSWTAVTTAS
jgi:hypothetical protein